MTERRLDLRGLKCPWPALRTAKALRGAVVGTRFRVACTDPLAVVDIPHLLQQTGDVLDGSETDPDGVTVFRIRKAAPPA